MNRQSYFFTFTTLLLLFGCEAKVTEVPTPVPARDRALESPQPLVAQDPLLVYSSKSAGNVTSVLEAFRAETGAGYRHLTNDSHIDGQLDESPDLLPAADVFVIGSYAELTSLAESDLFRPLVSERLELTIPAALRDAESRWVALAKRARVVVYNANLVSKNEIETVTEYASLQDESWLGRLCVSSSRLPGNRTLIAHMIHRYKAREAELIVRGWRANFAAAPFSVDATLIEAIADGRCAIGIVDSGLLAKHNSTNANSPVIAHWFEMANMTVIDVIGLGVSRHAHDPDGAVRLIEWLAAEIPNALFATQEMGFPANPDSPTGIAVKQWADKLADPVALADLEFLHEDAIRLVERARYP